MNTYTLSPLLGFQDLQGPVTVSANRDHSTAAGMHINAWSLLSTATWNISV